MADSQGVAEKGNGVNSERWERIKEIFGRAHQLSGEGRESYLDLACGDDELLRQEVVDLLSQSEGLDDSFLDPPDPFMEDDGSGGELLHNQRILGDFELLSHIGSGAMGDVYLARQVSLGRPVAVKVLKSISPASVEEFRLEATSVAALQHPNIVSIHSVGEDQGTHYFAMDFIEGASLRQVLHRMVEQKEGGESQGGPCDLEWNRAGYPARVAKVIHEVALALDYSHRQRIVHRDIKPGNILLDRNLNPHLADFGLAKDLGIENFLRTRRQAGTPYYMSPEQTRVQEILFDHRTDIYSLGVVMYEMLTLNRPFNGETALEIFTAIQEQEPTRIRKLNPKVPKDLETICRKSMEKSADNRYSEAGELAKDLQRFLNHESILARPPSIAELMRRGLVRHRVAGAVGVLLLLLAVFLPRVVEALADRKYIQEALLPIRALASEVSLAGVPIEDLMEAGVQIAALSESLGALAPEDRKAVEAASDHLFSFGQKQRDEGERLLREPLSSNGVRSPIEDLDRFSSGIRRLIKATLLLPDDPDIRSLTHPDFWNPRLTLSSRGGLAGSVYLRKLDPIDSAVIGSGDLLGESLGDLPLTELSLPFGYHQLLVVGDRGYGELMLFLDERFAAVVQETVLRPTEDVVAGMIQIPSGSFEFGFGSEAAAPYHRQQVDLPGFWIDATEVSNREYKVFVDETNHRKPPLWPTPYDSALDDLPVVSVSYLDAKAYSAWAGKRLPTCQEWERATRGQAGQLYPVLEQPVNRTLYVVGGENPLGDLHDPQEFWAFSRELYFKEVSPVRGGEPGPEGLFRTLGNVREWTESMVVTRGEAGAFRLTPGQRFIKGGCWWYSPTSVSLAIAEPAPTDLVDRSLGFRCAKSLMNLE